MGKQHKQLKKSKNDRYNSRDLTKTELKVFKIKKMKDEKELEENLFRIEFSKEEIDMYSFLCLRDRASNLSFYHSNIFTSLIRRYVC